jgi:hypothetical protein
MLFHWGSIIVSKKLITSSNVKSVTIFMWEFGPGQLTSFHFILMKLDFISNPSSKSTLPFAGLQHMQQCQLRVFPQFLFQALIQMNGA